MYLNKFIGVSALCLFALTACGTYAPNVDMGNKDQGCVRECDMDNNLCMEKATDLVAKNSCAMKRQSCVRACPTDNC